MRKPWVAWAPKAETPSFRQAAFHGWPSRHPMPLCGVLVLVARFFLINRTSTGFSAFVQSPSKSRDIVLSLLQTLQEGEESFAESGPGHFLLTRELASGAICDGEGALRRKYLFVGNTLRAGLLFPETA
jgi:hypothetical protein